jgi:hypothetical protein
MNMKTILSLINSSLMKFFYYFQQNMLIQKNSINYSIGHHFVDYYIVKIKF